MIVFIIFLVSIFIFWLTKGKGSKHQIPLPPGPKPLPYIGSIITMLRNKPTFRWIDRMMDETNTKILYVRLGNVSVIVVSDLKIACEFFKENDRIFSSRPDCMSGYLTSSGYLTTVLVPMSDHWKMMKKVLVTEIVSLARHKWLQNKRDTEASNLIRGCKCKDSGATKLLQHGNTDNGPGDEEIEYVHSFFTVLSYLYAFSVTDFFPWLRWITDFDGHERIIRKAIQTARKHQDHLIDKRIREWKDGIKTEKDDLLDVFINLKNPQLTAEQIKAQIFELVLASIDNPSNSIEWATSEMINQPRIFEKAVQELDSVVGKDRLLQESDLPNLNYIKSCVKEAFRLHPVAPFNQPHVSTMDTIVGGYFIPKGSHVLLSRPGLGRNPKIWDDPLTFNLDRHMKDDKEVVLSDHNLQLLSFSTGRRGCIGVLFGTTMTVMMLARLVHGFTWELPPRESHVDLKENIHDLWKAKPLLALAKPRLPHHLYPTC